MKLKKILEKVKNYLFLIQNNEDIKKRKIEKLRDKIDEEDALESLKVYAEIIDKMEEDDRLAAIEEAQNCPNR